MKDVTSNMKLAVADSGVYDLMGFESVIAFATVTTGFTLPAATVIKAGDDKTSLDTVALTDPAIVARFDGDDGKAAKISYIGGRRYMSITGLTSPVVVLVNPLVAPVGELDGEATATEAGGGGGGQQGGE